MKRFALKPALFHPRKVLVAASGATLNWLSVLCTGTSTSTRGGGIKWICRALSSGEVVQQITSFGYVHSNVFLYFLDCSLAAQLGSGSGAWCLCWHIIPIMCKQRTKKSTEKVVLPIEAGVWLNAISLSSHHKMLASLWNLTRRRYRVIY